MAGFRDKVWIIISAFLIISLVIGLFFFFARLRQLQPVEIVLNDAPFVNYGSQICITGAVARPGIYTMKPEDTVTTLISAAGLSDNSDVSGLKIQVPYRGETVQPQKVDLNRAETWLLAALPGIGEGKAKLIVDFRTEKGQFRSVDDLLNIGGFGQSTVDRIRDYVTIGD